MMTPDPTAPHSPPLTENPSCGALTGTLLAELRAGLDFSAADRACQNAVSNNGLALLALNRDILRGDDGHFSHRIQSKGIRNQKQSGRCWMFAGLNVLRPQIIREHRMEDFEFSTAYLQFWDKLEKANLFLEEIMALRGVDFLDRDWEAVNKFTLGDGGWWNFLTGLIGKYGVVPLAAMPETHATRHTHEVNEVLGRLLRNRAVRISNLHEAGAGLPELRAAKEVALHDVYRFLVMNFGQPPAEFEWRYRLAAEPSGEDPRPPSGPFDGPERLTQAETHTPYSFREKYVGSKLDEHVCLYNDPHSPLNQHYSFDRARNMVGEENMRFVNIDMNAMKEIASTSIQAGEPVWFAVNMGFDQSEAHGLMEHELFDYGTLFNLDVSVSKADRTRYHAGASCHAMTVMGVDLDSSGKPRKWLVENSWGDKKGNQGCWTLGDKWFDEHVYTIIVHKSHVPEAILNHFQQAPVTLPAWYPGASGMMGRFPLTGKSCLC